MKTSINTSSRLTELLKGSSWFDVLADELRLPYMRELETRLDSERSSGKVLCPEPHNVFRALTLTPWESVRVVVIGQDPYHGDGQANGLAFAVNKGLKLPPSVRNIFKELNSDLNLPAPTSATLLGWAEQGVLLLNSVLTVQAHKPFSHAGYGWERFTESIVRRLNDHPEALVFLLWGAPAQKKAQWITNPRHLILTSAHPSPLSAHRGFFGCRHFSKANEFLRQSGRRAVRWECSDASLE
jgi:uracil-DNA glycosylase